MGRYFGLEFFSVKFLFPELTYGFDFLLCQFQIIDLIGRKIQVSNFSTDGLAFPLLTKFPITINLTSTLFKIPKS